MMPEALEISLRTIKWFKGVFRKFNDEAQVLANFPTMFMGTVDAKGNLEHYDGTLRLIDAKGLILEELREPRQYQDIVAEAVEPFSFMKFPYYRKQGYPDGIYRVGPLARLNVIDRCGTPLADREWTEFRALRL